MAVESMVSSVQTSMQSWSFSSSLPLSRLQRQLASMSTDNSLENGLSFTPLEQSMDIVLGIAFLITALVAARRMSTTLQASPASAASSPGAEAAVVTAFYSLILLTSVLRALWFLVPAQWWQPSYTPAAVYAWDSTQPSWIGTAISEIIVTGGSLSLFSIFILILVYWADILKKYFHPGSRRSLPLMTFLGFVATLLALALLNVFLFLLGLYTTEGMILYHAVLLAVVSIICVCEITIFSHRFRTILKTLGAINQVSTDSQIRRIVWITLTGNLFFVTRATLELAFCLTLVFYWHQTGTVARPFTHLWWDLYTGLKYASELTIMALMLYILQSRFHAAASAAATAVQQHSSVAGARPSTATTASRPSLSGPAYTRIPDVDVVVV